MESLQGVEPEPRRHAFGGATEVAAGETQDGLARRGGEHGQERPVVIVGPGTTERKLSVERAALVVGEQGVLAMAGGERALRESEHDDAVELQAEAHGDTPHEQAVTEAADPTEARVELQLEGTSEHGERRLGLDVVEAGEAVERALDALGGVDLVLGPGAPLAVSSEEVLEQTVGPLRLVGPRRR